MTKYILHYWTDMMRCGCGGNVGGTCTIELNDEEKLLLNNCIIPASHTRDMLHFFEEYLPEDLCKRVSEKITESFKRVSAGDAYDLVGTDILDPKPINVSRLSRNKIIDLIISQTDYSDFEFKIVDLDIRRMPKRNVYTNERD